MQRAKGLLRVLLFGAALAMLGFALLHKPAPPVSDLAEPNSYIVRCAAATRGPLAETVGLNGTLQPLQRVELTAALPARVVAVGLKEGARVAPGALVARFDDRELRAQIGKAQAGVNAAAATVSKARIGALLARQVAESHGRRAASGLVAAQRATEQAELAAKLTASSAEADLARALAGEAAAAAALEQAKVGVTLARGSAEADVELARNGVAAALADLERARQGAAVGHDAAAADVLRAKAGVDAAKANLAKAQAGARPGELAAAQANVDQARAGRDQAQKTFDEVDYLHKHGGVSGAERDGARTQLKVAQSQLEAAEAQLRNAKAGASPAELAAAEALVREAEAGLAAAEAGRGRSSVSAAEVAAAQSAVDRARSGLKAAQAASPGRLEAAEGGVKAAQAALDQAKAGRQAAQAGLQQSEIRRAEAAAARANALMAAEGVSEAQTGRGESAVHEAELSAAQAGLVAAQADLRLASEQLAKTLLTAPVGGTVTKLSLHVGDNVMPGQPLAVIETTGAAELEALATAGERARLRPGQQARITVEGVAGVCHGTVRAVATSAESDGRSFKVRLLVAGHDLPPGSQARAEVDVAVEPDALLVPLGAIVDLDSREPYLFVDDAGQAKRRRLTLGLRGVAKVQVLDGLNAGEQVVVEGADGLRDGAKIEVVAPEGQRRP